MKQFETKKSPKNPKYVCEICEYITNNKKDYDKHTLTSKHQNETQMKQISPKNPQKSPTYECNCGILCNSRTSLWRHKKTCDSNKPNMNIEDINHESNKVMNDKDLIMMLIHDNKELRNLLLEQCKEKDEFKNMMMKVLENGTHNTTNNTNHTNSHNKAFNLQFFLNETCKDAMNIMDFVESIQLQLSDLENVGELGYVEGISNIIVKNLKELDVTQRPVHCTDKKRETIYIKDENKWEKDDEKNKIRKMIKRVASKNQRLLLKFKELHPDCIKYHSKYSDQYNKLIVESMGGSGNNDLEKEDKIIRNIVKNVVVDKGN